MNAEDDTASRGAGNAASTSSLGEDSVDCPLPAVGGVPAPFDGGGPECVVQTKEGGKSGSDKIEILVSSPDNVAISFRDSYKHYGRGRRKVPVLIGLNMTIPKGAIYGLLGPSGCGKTTLLSCIVGKKGLNAGSIEVFGGSPGSSISGKLVLFLISIFYKILYSILITIPIKEGRRFSLIFIPTHNN